jgi:hypothetical protein
MSFVGDFGDNGTQLIIAFYSILSSFHKFLNNFPTFGSQKWKEVNF